MPSLKSMGRKLTTRDGWLVGKKPRKATATPFYALDEDLPIAVAAICGFQHSLASLAGIITPPMIFSSSLKLPTDYQNYMVAASLITSGIMSCLQMTRWRIPFTNKYYGTGLLNIVGTSFSTLSTASAIFDALYKNGTCTSTTVDGITSRDACPAAFGHLLGTSALCSLAMMGLSFVPPLTLKRIFSPIVTGGVVVLIGASLVGSSGFLNWAGGSNGCQSHPDAPSIYELCPTIYAPRPLPWGDAKFLGLGFLTYMTIVTVEFFGSPFMKNASIIMGLLVGMIVAGACGYVDSSTITDSPAITFLWVKTFPLKIYAPAILPLIFVYIALACEAIGDITASSEASRQPTSGPLYSSRVQGGILADGFNGLYAALCTVPPLSIFAQNSGVIVLTRCANRGAGYWCCGFLILYGVLAKISGVFLAIPNSVLGGVTTFLFSTVLTSGVRVLAMINWTRRDRFIMAAAFSFGLGNLLVDDWAAYMFTYEGSNSALKGFMDAIVIVVSTPFLIYAIVAVILNLTLPHDPDTLIAVEPVEKEKVENAVIAAVEQDETDEALEKYHHHGERHSHETRRRPSTIVREIA